MTIISRPLALAGGAALLVGVLGAGISIGAGASAGSSGTAAAGAAAAASVGAATSSSVAGTTAADSTSDAVDAALAAFDGAGTSDLVALAAPDTTAGPVAGIGERIRRFARWKQLVHASLTVNRPTAGLQTFNLDHGTITTVASGSLTLSEAGGTSVTVATDTTTRVRKDRQKASLADLRLGDEVVVVSKAGASGTPQAILVVVPPTAPKAATP